MEYGSNYPLQLLTGVKSRLNIEEKFNKPNVYYLVNGRSAIYSIVKHLKGYKNVYLPNYICEDVYRVFASKIKKFYTLSQQFEYKNGLDKISNEKFIIYVSNYFGLSNENKIFKIVENLKKNNDVFVIYDITHNLYTAKPNKNVDAYVASLRKWLYIPDGALLATDINLKVANKTMPSAVINEFITSSYFKSLYVNSNSSIFSTDLYRQGFITAEQSIGKILKPFAMSKQSRIIYEMFNHDEMIKRRDNYNTILRLLNNERIKPVFNQEQKSTIPFCLPILCNERDKLRSFLINNKVYCAIHWKQDFLIKSSNYNLISEGILSIPIDQRHCEEDMIRLAEILNRYGGQDV